MTERISELLNALRDEDNCNVLDYVDDAADLIESLAAEFEHVKQERDALLKEIKHVSFPLCITCKHRNGVHCRKVFYEDGKRALEALCVTACAHYLWRGVQEADNAEND